MAAQARLSVHLSKRHIVGNHVSRLNYYFFQSPNLKKKMRAKGKKGGKLRKKEIPKTSGKEAAKQARQKPVESTRSTRGASRTPLQEKVALKRKASPSPVPKKVTPAKKTRSASPSPATAARLVSPALKGGGGGIRARFEKVGGYIGFGSYARPLYSFSFPLNIFRTLL